MGASYRIKRTRSQSPRDQRLRGEKGGATDTSEVTIGDVPQFTLEEQTEAKEHADSWIEGVDLEHVKVSVKTIPPPPQEPS